LALDLGDVVTRTNRFLVADIEDSLFVTLFLLLLDPRSASFVSVSAGHNAYLFEPEKHVKVLRSTGLPLGIDDTATFLPTDQVTLEPGQILVLVTDSISEAATAENSLFGMKRLAEVVHGSRKRSASEIVEAVLEASHAFSATGSRHDDKTAIVVKRNPIS